MYTSCIALPQRKTGERQQGRDISYTSLGMADYLLPQANMSIVDQRELFSIRCRTNNMGANRGIIEYCETGCGEILNNYHIFQCVQLIIGEQKYNIDKVLNGFIAGKKEHLKIWRENMKKKQVYLGTQ